MSVVYLDLGTHAEAAELIHMVDHVLPRLCDDFESHAFEASPEIFARALRQVGDRPRVTLRNLALCRELPEGGRLRLYRDDSTGLGNSLYRNDGAEFDEVEALRLSDWIRGRGIDPETSIVLLRMNIEGAEYDVLQDLVESGAAGTVDGWFGMWDDVAKIDAARDRDFRSLMTRAGVSPFTFNGRDFLFRPRLACIEYDTSTAVLGALRRRRFRRTATTPVSASPRS
jgi:FkbM family methyltransferase